MCSPPSSRENRRPGAPTRFLRASLLPAVLVVAACGSPPAPAPVASPPPPLTAEQVTYQLVQRVPSSTLTTAYTADTDPNKLLGRPGGYLSKTAFTDSRATSGMLSGPDSVSRGGSVEVFADEVAAAGRRQYIQDIGRRAPIFGEYDYQRGKILVRVSRQLTPAQAAEYESALNAIVDGAAAPPASPASAGQAAPPTVVSVQSVHDAATVLLTDGTRLRQVGVSAPDPGSCHADQAKAAADTELRRGALTYQLVGQSDLYGNQWAYLRIDSTDLGEKLAGLGWVWAYPDSPAPREYHQRIASQVDRARAARLGLFGTTCPGSAAPLPAPAAPAASTIEDGTWVVGTEVQPGTYRTEGPSDDTPIKMCVWSRRKDTSGEIGSVLATNIAQGPTTVTIKPSDGAFESRGCRPWTKVG